MMKIRKIENDAIATIYPDNEFLENYQNDSFAEFVSTIQVQAMIGDGVFRLGDSKTTVKLTTTGHNGERGIEELKTLAKEICELAKQSIDLMSNEYAKFYEHFVNDFEKHGLTMPFYGKIM